MKAHSQIEYMHSVGAAIVTDITNYSWPAIEYDARLNIAELGDMTLSISGRPGLGFYLSSNDYYGENYIGLDLPIVADINGGMGATNNDDDGFGYFVGAGVEYSLLVGTEGIFGPVGNAGIRVNLFEKPLEGRVGYMFDITGSETGQLTIGFAYLLWL